MRKENASFSTKFISESGSYLTNADYFAFVELRDYACYVVADGIDCDEKKESAKLAITTIITKFSENPGMSGGKLKQYLKAAHQILLEEADEIRLEVSILILVTDYKKAMWAHAGNCRLYWMKNGTIRAVTKDTSLTQKMVDKEEVPLDQLAYHEERNNLYTYLGQPGRFTPVISGKKKLEDGDIFLLMTHGVWENVGEAEIIDSVEGVSKAEDVCTGLEDVILSQRMNVVENYTIAAVFVDKIYNNPKAGKYKKWIKIGISAGMVVGMLLLGFFVMRYQKNQSNIEKMEKYKERGIEYLAENNYAMADEQFDEAYSTSENINARKNSESAQKVQCIEIYDKMSENLRLAAEALQEEEYKKAANLYQEAIGLANTLKEEYGQDISSYIDGIDTYQNYAFCMNAGMDASEAGDYEAAIKNFAEASETMDAIDDTTNRNVAEEALNQTNAQKALDDGAAFEAKGKELWDKESYAQALVQYQSAKDMYTLAKDNYGSTEAADKIALVDINMNNIQETIDKLSNKELEKEANGYIDMASEAAHDGDYDKAAEYYEAAKEIFQQTENTDQIIAINDKLDAVQYGPDEEVALANVLDALAALARGDINSANAHLGQAKQAYNKLGDTEHANRMQEILNSLVQ